MSDARIIGAYGKRFKASIDSCEDFAIYFSASDPYEIAIFKCYSKIIRNRYKIKFELIEINYFNSYSNSNINEKRKYITN